MSARNLVLILMFGGLFYGMYALYRNQTRRPLEADLIALDTAQVDQILLHPKEEAGRPIRLQRADGHWIVSNGQVHLRALNGPVQALLANLERITTIDVAAKTEAEWPLYGLGPGQGRRITVFVNNEPMEDFWLGSGSSPSDQGDSIAYLRLHEETEVYAVKGLSSRPFHHAFLYFRPKRFLSLSDANPVDSFTVELPDTTLLIARAGEYWLINGRMPDDSTAVQRYLAELRRLQAELFADDFDGQRLERNNYRRLTFHLQDQEQPILIESYWDTLREHPFVLRSSQNPGSWFASDSGGIYRPLFEYWKAWLTEAR